MPELRTEVYRFSEARVSDFRISIREGKKNAENVDWCLREKIGIPRKIGDFTALDIIVHVALVISDLH